jgi:virginiamycin B lyase
LDTSRHRHDRPRKPQRHRVDPTFISGLDHPGALAVDGAHIYWGNRCIGSCSIGRANIDGSGVDQNFITGAAFPTGVAVDGAYVYWSNLQSETIGRANLNGTGVDQNFISPNQAAALFGVAVDASHIYWGNSAADTIERANLDGQFVAPLFITGAVEPRAVAVDGLTAPGRSSRRRWPISPPPSMRSGCCTGLSAA